MHSNATLNKFAVDVRPASQSDMNTLYKAMEASTYANDADPSTRLIYLNGHGYQVGRMLRDVVPLLVYEFHGDLKDVSMLLVGNLPLDSMNKESSFAWQFLCLYRGRYGSAVTIRVADKYLAYLKHVRNDIRNRLSVIFPENKAFDKWYVQWTEVDKAFQELGLEGLFPNKPEMNRFRKRVKPLMTDQPQWSAQRIVGYLLFEASKSNKESYMWAKLGEMELYHNLVKDLVGHKFVVGHPSYEDWWSYCTVGELTFV